MLIDFAVALLHYLLVLFCSLMSNPKDIKVNPSSQFLDHGWVYPEISDCPNTDHTQDISGLKSTPDTRDGGMTYVQPCCHPTEDLVGEKASHLPKGHERVENPHASGYCCCTCCTITITHARLNLLITFMWISFFALTAKYPVLI